MRCSGGGRVLRCGSPKRMRAHMTSPPVEKRWFWFRRSPHPTTTIIAAAAAAESARPTYHRRAADRCSAPVAVQHRVLHRQHVLAAATNPAGVHGADQWARCGVHPPGSAAVPLRADPVPKFEYTRSIGA
ncbi:hypothetical protein ACI65C_006656 [Semiaphis heraclei]